MTTVASPADQTSDLMQKLSIDSTKSHDPSEAIKKSAGVQHGHEVKNWHAPSSDRSTTPVMPAAILDPNLCYAANGPASPAYYYGVNEWEEFPRYLSPGIEMSPHGIYGDMYHGYTYAPYGVYGPGSGVPTVGHDGQLYSPQPYQYTGAYYQHNAPMYPTNTSTKPPSQPDVSTTSAPEHPPLSADKVKSNSDGVVSAPAANGSLSSKPNQKNSTPKSSYNRGSVPGVPPPSYQDQRFGHNGMRSPAHWVDSPVISDVQQRFPAANTGATNTPHAGGMTTPRNQNIHPLPSFMGSHPQGPVAGMGLTSPGSTKALSNNQFYGQYFNVPRNRQPFVSSLNNFQANGRSWQSMDSRYNVRGQGVGFYGYGNENMEVLNELNRGPRSNRIKNGQKNLGSNVVLAVKGQSLPDVGGNEDSNSIPAERDQYNKDDFSVNYQDAKFFVIKSYSEDDVHKSIKYGVWASTPNGNKKLDDAYKEAQEKPNHCPVFLLFSVNTSGQFVGVAEMTGPVDFDKTMDYWQQDKWNGCFPVKWHIVKDVPNSILKHIILENNENKPVTNSRDTQEVRLEQGNQLLKLFKDHVSKTSVLDDFGFYETRQKIMQAKRIKQQFQKQVWDGKAVPTLSNINISDVVNAKQKLQKPWEPASTVNSTV